MKWFWKNRKLAFGFIGIIFVLLAFLGLRTWFFNHTVEKVKSKLESNYQLKFTIGENEFVGLNQLAINNILVKSSRGDTIFYTDSLYLQLKVLQLLKQKIRFKNIYAHRVEGTLKESEIETALQSKEPLPISNYTKSSQNYALTMGRIAKTVFSLFPNEVLIDSAKITYQSAKGDFEILCPTFAIKNNQIKGHLQFTNGFGNFSECKVNGNLDSDHESVTLNLEPYLSDVVTIPVFEQIWGLGIRFDTLQFGFTVLSTASDLFKFSGYINTNQLSLNHLKLAPKPVIIDQGGIHFNASVGKNIIEIDSSSVITLNQISFSPYICYNKQSHQELSLKIIQKEFESSAVFQSFPEGLFTNIRDMKTKGKVSYGLNFRVNLDNPDSLFFSSELTNKSFRVEHFGTTNLTQLNDTFTYEVISTDEKVRSIFVGTQNPNYIPLQEISNYLKFAVITSEDGGFYYHKGFDLESIKKSISDNLKEGRFARGGSTITMQLVKNVFLSKNKTISRKLEELLIVWMIENQNLTTKDRMFEVYLNIIEWGPGIYGIKEASEFYFDKKPSQLTLNESIFMASIVPSPKNFRFTFNKEGNLRDYYAEYYRFLSETMLSRNSILPEDTIGLIPNVVLTGEAKNYLVKTDSLQQDSLPTSIIITTGEEIVPVKF